MDIEAKVTPEKAEETEETAEAAEEVISEPESGSESESAQQKRPSNDSARSNEDGTGDEGEEVSDGSSEQRHHRTRSSDDSSDGDSSNSDSNRQHGSGSRRTSDRSSSSSQQSHSSDKSHSRKAESEEDEAEESVNEEEQDEVPEGTETSEDNTVTVTGGAEITYTVSADTLTKDFTADEGSCLILHLMDGISYSGQIITASDADADIVIDEGCTWILTGDCSISGLENNGLIEFCGYTITFADGTEMSG